MELYFNRNTGDITYLSELIPTNALKLWNRILARLMSRDRIDNIYPLPKHPENLFDIFGIGFGINSRIDLLTLACRQAGGS